MPAERAVRELNEIYDVLKFLLSKERNLDTFCQRRPRKRVPALLEVYPKGVVRPDFGPSRADAAKEEMQLLAGEWSLLELVTPDGNVTKYDGDSGSLPGERRPCTLILQGDTVTTIGHGPGPLGELNGLCRLNPKRRPKIIDFVLLDTSFRLREWRGRATPGIYELDAERLRLCIPGGDSKDRPSSFGPGGGNYWLYTFRPKKS